MTSSSPLPDPADKSLGAMVARFEAGLTRRRQDAIAKAAIPSATGVAAEDEPEVDFALEAAPSTLQRMTRTTVRSEEHTSELQSLMSTSLAIYCLKKKHT